MTMGKRDLVSGDSESIETVGQARLAWSVRAVVQAARTFRCAMRAITERGKNR